MNEIKQKVAANSRITYFKQKGDPYIFATGLGLVVSLAMVAFILIIILTKGLGFFWPRNVHLFTLKSGNQLLGEIWEKDTRYQQLPDGREIKIKELKLKIGNRDVYGLDFKWIDLPEVAHQTQPPFATVIERMEYGTGRPSRLKNDLKSWKQRLQNWNKPFMS